MAHKIILADDSQTIQKVIKITLANEPYEIIEVTTEEELLKKAKEIRPSMVLLDFTLSEKNSGYQLCREVRNLLPKVGVLMMFGTFDSIDENQLKECQAANRIIKPFDSTKFINVCRTIIEQIEQTGEIKIADILPKEELERLKTNQVKASHEQPKESDSWNNWVIDNSKVEKKESSVTRPIEMTFTSNDKSEKSPLSKEIESWGMSVPETINKKTNAEKSELPPSMTNKVAEIKNTLGHLETETKKGHTGPNFRIEEVIVERKTAEIKENEIGQDNIDKLFANFKLEHGKSEKDETLEIGDDWAEFDLEKVLPNESHEKLVPLDELKDIEYEKLTAFEEDTKEISRAKIFKDLDESFPKEKKGKKKEATGLDFAQIENEIKEKITPIIEKMVKDYCRTTLEKVAWEVIPDLAENIIKKELGRITDSVLSKSDL